MRIILKIALCIVLPAIVGACTIPPKVSSTDGPCYDEWKTLEITDEWLGVVNSMNGLCGISMRSSSSPFNYGGQTLECLADLYVKGQGDSFSSLGPRQISLFRERYNNLRSYRRCVANVAAVAKQYRRAHRAFRYGSWPYHEVDLDIKVLFFGS
tara:strand:+ start:4378 stop:4839 length:462 start_codon:yes stop_codon:yes gene_type:complete